MANTYEIFYQFQPKQLNVCWKIISPYIGHGIRWWCQPCIEKVNIVWPRVVNKEYISVIEGTALPFVFQTFDSPSLSPPALVYCRQSRESQMFVRRRGVLSLLSLIYVYSLIRSHKAVTPSKPSWPAVTETKIKMAAMHWAVTEIK